MHENICKGTMSCGRLWMVELWIFSTFSVFFFDCGVVNIFYFFIFLSWAMGYLKKTGTMLLKTLKWTEQ